MAEIVELLAEVVGAGNVLAGDDMDPDYAHDEALTATPSAPLAVVRPGDTAEVAAVLKIADELHVPVTARGSGTGLSGAAISPPDGILVSFERMNAILEIDLDNHVAVVQPGVTLEQLNTALAEHGLVYPVFPGESERVARGQRGHQRRGHAGRQVRRHAPSRARARGRARQRRRDPHRRASS